MRFFLERSESSCFEEETQKGCLNPVGLKQPMIIANSRYEMSGVHFVQIITQPHQRGLVLIG